MAHHDHYSMVQSKRLIYSIIIIAVTMLAEIVGGIISHSLALLSDAGHMLIDLFALILSWLAHKLSAKQSDLQRSYGYHRLQVIAAFVNGLTLFLIAIVVVIEATKRFVYPIEIEWKTMLIIAVFGLVSNIMVFFVLHKKNEGNINIKSAVLHVMGDILGSIAAILASVIIVLTGWQIVDPILSIFFSVIILGSGCKIIKNSCHILLEGTPKNLSIQNVKTRMVLVHGVMDVHHIHVWSLSDTYFIMTMHVRARDTAQHTKVLYDIKKALLDNFNIVHSTIEIEYDECLDDKMLKH